MPRRFGIIMTTILDCIDLDVPFFPLENPFHFVKRKRLKREQYMQALWRMQRQGYLKILKKNNKKFVKLTSKGQLEKLFQKASFEKQEKWDGKWRLIIFDIPESSHLMRDKFRWLLKRNNFIKLQASVFVSPFSLNREAIKYLDETGLKSFIRLLKVEEMDNDNDLKKKFTLLNPRPSI